MQMSYQSKSVTEGRVTHSVATIGFIFPSRLLSFCTRLFVFLQTLLLTVLTDTHIAALAAYNTDAFGVLKLG